MGGIVALSRGLYDIRLATLKVLQKLHVIRTIVAKMISPPHTSHIWINDIHILFVVVILLVIVAPFLHACRYWSSLKCLLSHTLLHVVVHSSSKYRSGLHLEYVIQEERHAWIHPHTMPLHHGGIAVPWNTSPQCREHGWKDKYLKGYLRMLRLRA